MEDNERKPRADIMAVDDSPSNLQVLTRMLQEHGYKVRPVPNGSLALQAAARVVPDLVLLDISMPEMDGFTVCERMKADPTLREVPVIFLSGHAEMNNKVHAFDVGGVDYITKPFQMEEVLARVETHIKLRSLQQELMRSNESLERRVQAQVRDISDLQMATIFAMAKLAEYRDLETGQHLERVRRYCRLLATRLMEMQTGQGRIQEGFCDTIFQSSPLHDIGKVGIPDSILLKPARLTAVEFEVIKQHTLIGAEALRAVQAQYPKHPFVTMGIDIAMGHHERWDGTGYPNGIRGTDIPLAARIMAVADVYDAMVSKRIYKDPIPHQETSEYILSAGGTHFDPLVVEAFRALQEEFWHIRLSLE